MPIQYTGVLEEHRACREHAVVFDVSHLGSVHVHGAGAFAALQWAFTNDLDRIGPGRAQYTHLLDPDDAHVVDDIIVWWVAPGEFLVMPNASNTATAHRRARRGGRRSTAGASARSSTSPPRARCSRCRVPRRASALATVAPDARRGRAVRGASRSSSGASAGWIARHRLHRRGRRRAARARRRGSRRAGSSCSTPGSRPRGSARRDTLRLEAGLPLHGHELGPGDHARCRPAWPGWCASTRATSAAAAPLEAEHDRGVARRLRGLSVDGPPDPARRATRCTRDGEVVGVVTSGNFSPTLGHGIALAFLPARHRRRRRGHRRRARPRGARRSSRSCRSSRR